MLRRHFAILGLGFATGVALSGTSSGCIRDNPNHCLNNDGDAFCERKYPDWDNAYCSSCETTPEYDGCVEEPPEAECWSCNGKDGDNSNCMVVGDGDGDPGDGDGDGDGEPTGDGDGEPTGDGDGDTAPDCLSSDECDGSTPFCEDGSCVGCDEAQASTCAGEYPDTPVCEGSSGSCVECTIQDTSACPSSAPACEDNFCVSCSSHDQCPGSACELELGTCFDSMVFHVDGDASCMGANGSEAMPYCTIAAAVNAIGAGQTGVVILHEAASTYNESITVAGNGTKVAFIAASGEVPVWRNGANASLRADGGGTIFVHKIAFRGSTNSALIASLGGIIYLTSSQIANSQLAGIVVSDGTLFLQNSFVGTSNFNTPAVTISAGTFEIEYSTLGTTSGTVVNCTNGGAGSSIRNSIALTFDAVPELSCANATKENVFIETDAGELFTPGSGWFEDFPNGDFHINDNAPAAFTGPLSSFATWTTGDPKVDIDGDPRVNVAGQAGHAGADVPP